MFSQDPCGGVVDLQALCQRPGFGCGEGLVEGPDGVGIEIVHHQHDFLGIGIVNAEQVINFLSPVDSGCAGCGR